MQSNDTVHSFRALHAGAAVLVLPNVWDAASAALFARAGAKAIATTSGGLAWACGFADGRVVPRESLLFAVSAVCRVVGRIPVTVDLEAGYSDDPDRVAALVGDLCGLGIAGINLEDGMGTAELLAAKIEAIRRSVAASGRDVFINARTDIFLRELASGQAAVTETIARAARYVQAGADAIFVPALAARDDIAAVAAAVAAPLGVLAVPGMPPLADLYALGVRRISAGVSLAEIAYGTARQAARTFLQTATCDPAFDEYAAEYGAMNALFE